MLMGISAASFIDNYETHLIISKTMQTGYYGEKYDIINYKDQTISFFYLDTLQRVMGIWTKNDWNYIVTCYNTHSEEKIKNEVSRIILSLLQSVE